MVGTNRRLEFWGVRGTVATPAPDRLRYGGNTSCAAVRLSETEHLVLDCGTGARRLGREIEKRRAGREGRVDILFSHYHLDHTEGLTLFAPLYAASFYWFFRVTLGGNVLLALVGAAMASVE